MRSIFYSKYVRLTLASLSINHMLHYVHVSHHKSSFILIPSEHRSFSLIPFGLGILYILSDEYRFVHTLLPRVAVNRCAPILLWKGVYDAYLAWLFLPYRLPCIVPTTSNLCHRFRPALLLYCSSSSYSSIEEYIATSETSHFFRALLNHSCGRPAIGAEGRFFIPSI